MTGAGGWTAPGAGENSVSMMLWERRVPPISKAFLVFVVCAYVLRSMRFLRLRSMCITFMCWSSDVVQAFVFEFGISMDFG